MSLVYRFLGSPIFLVVNASIVLYVCQRLWRAMRYHHQLMLETKDFESTVKKARFSLDYVGEEVSSGMQGIKEDIKQELCMTDRMTNLSFQVTGIVQRFTALEEDILEFIRKDRNAESVRLETPYDVKEEVRKVLKKVNESQVADTWKDEDGMNHMNVLHGTSKTSRRNPLSKFSTVVEAPTFLPTKEKQDRPKSPVMMEVQLLQGMKPSVLHRREKKRE